MMLTQRELRSMRATVADALADLCTVRARSVSIDAMGSESVTWTETANVPCRLYPEVVRNVRTDGEQFAVHGGWVLAVRYDQAISSGDQVVHGGQTYIVLTSEDATTERVLRRARLRRVD